jgi:hypothetical protein
VPDLQRKALGEISTWLEAPADDLAALTKPRR